MPKQFARSGKAADSDLQNLTQTQKEALFIWLMAIAARFAETPTGPSNLLLDIIPLEIRHTMIDIKLPKTFLRFRSAVFYARNLKNQN